MTDDVNKLSRALEGRYQIERALGRGAMATVYLAKDLKHDRKVAIKVLRPDASSELGAERFGQEIRIAARFTHPHILPVFDSGSAEGLLYYVMPVVEGESLRDRITRGGQLPVGEAVRITKAVAAALDYAHRHGTVHRDIKPENILLHEDHPFVADFGIGKGVTAATAETVAMTGRGLALGTPAYMSPEQATGDTVDGRSDLYSLGCVLYEMLTGEQPFTGDTVQSVIAKRLTSLPTPVADRRAGISAAVTGAVSTLLQPTAADRFQTGAAVVEALTQGTLPEARLAPVVETKSIAVLPFTNLSADPENEYFSDGITDDIIAALGPVPDLHVASRSSSFAFKGQPLEMSEVAARLKVGHVLEGSVRRAGDRVRITAQLVDVASDTQLWSSKFDRGMDDIFAVQDEIATAIARKLEVTLGRHGRGLVQPPTSNLEAYHAYLKGRHLWVKRGKAMAQALPFFQQAVDTDPNFAAAHAGLADTYGMLGVWGYLPPAVVHQRAGPASRRALELDEDLAEAHAARGAFEFFFAWDLQAAEWHLRRAMALKPSDGVSRIWLAQMFGFMGQHETSMMIARQAQRVEPFSPLVFALAGFCFAFAGHLQEAHEAANWALHLADDYSPAAQVKGLAYLYGGEADTALEWFDKGLALSDRAPMILASAAMAYGKLGRSEDASRTIEEIKRTGNIGLVAWAEAALGYLDSAFEHCREAFEARASVGWALGNLPQLEAFRDDPRWPALLHSVNMDRPEPRT